MAEIYIFLKAGNYVSAYIHIVGREAEMTTLRAKRSLYNLNGHM